jgi:hypothetical protein
MDEAHAHAVGAPAARGGGPEIGVEPAERRLEARRAGEFSARQRPAPERDAAGPGLGEGGKAQRLARPRLDQRQIEQRKDGRGKSRRDRRRAEDDRSVFSFVGGGMDPLGLDAPLAGVGDLGDAPGRALERNDVARRERGGRGRQREFDACAACPRLGEQRLGAPARLGLAEDNRRLEAGLGAFRARLARFSKARRVIGRLVIKAEADGGRLRAGPC